MVSFSMSQQKSRAPRLVVVASYMRDISVGVDHFPLPGETRVGTDSLESHGGKGSNQAIQAARCGAAVSIVAAVGADAAGAAAQAAWSAEGLESSGVVVRVSSPTGLAVILVNGEGQNQIVIAPGANQTLLPVDIDRGHVAIEAADLVIAQLETPLDSTIRAFELARAARVQTLLNTAPAPATLPPALWALTDILVANEIEAATLADRPLDTDPGVLGQLLLLRVARAVVITLGDQGAVLFQHGQAPLSCPALQVSVKDSTGAGDAFVGAFATAWAAGAAATDALMLGITAGSLACTGRGVVPALADGQAIRTAAEQLQRA